jgi:streptogramin lyase
MIRLLHTYTFIATALVFTAASGYATLAIHEITLPGTRVFPESITSTADGTLIVGSLGHGNVSRIAPGKTMAEEWIKPGTSGLNQVLGVYADEKGKTLWVCSNNLEKKGEATSVKAFDLKSGALKASYPLPGEDALCNDIAVAADGTAYVADTLAENSGKMDIVTFEGSSLRSAVVKTIKEGLESTPGVTATRGMAWIVEGKLNYRNDPQFKDKDPGIFKMYAVPLPKN